MEERKTLEMVFVNAANKQVQVTVYDPKDSLTRAEVITAAENIIAKNIFNSTGGDLQELADMRIRVISVTNLV